MQIEQEKEFQTITMKLETEAEARMLWDMVLQCSGLNQSPERNAFVIRISNWFSNEASL